MSGELNDVVIVGAGAMGCAVAYYLGKEGIGSTIVERDGVAAHASGYSAGGLNPLEGTGIPGPLGPLAITSFRMHKEIWPELAERSSHRLRSEEWCRWSGSRSMSRTWPSLRRLSMFSTRRMTAFSAGWLSGDELRELEPRISPRCAVRPGDIGQRRTRQPPIHAGARQDGGDTGSGIQVRHGDRDRSRRRQGDFGSDRGRGDTLRSGCVRDGTMVGWGR